MKVVDLGLSLSLCVLLLCLFTDVIGSVGYKAAVIDYSPVYSTENVNRTEAIDIMSQNLDQYEQYIAEAKKNGCQIILFPEDGLYGAAFYSRDSILPYLEPIPEVVSQEASSNANPIPCNFGTTRKEISPILSRASCLAIQYNITIVLNMGEIQSCSQHTNEDCPKDNRLQYNTLVAFSSSGSLVAKYHKSHLYYEPQFNAPAVPDVVWFDSDFGVRFGLMICFDLMFEEPQLSLYNQGIRNFLWSSWWVNEPPLTTGTQMELARSSARPSNFLASGIGLSWYNSGSGIYSFGEALQHWYNSASSPITKLMMANLPATNDSLSKPSITIHSPPVPVVVVPRLEEDEPTIKTFTAIPGFTGVISATSNNLTCTASVSISESSVGDELFAVYSLQGIYNNLFDAQVCALFKCSETTCTAVTLRSNTTFTSFALSGTFTQENLFMMYPYVSRDHCIIANTNSYFTKPGKLLPTSIQSSQEGILINAALFGLNKNT